MGADSGRRKSTGASAADASQHPEDIGCRSRSGRSRSRSGGRSRAADAGAKATPGREEKEEEEEVTGGACAVPAVLSSNVPALSVKKLKGSFGAVVEGQPALTPAWLRHPAIGKQLKDLWHHSGVLIVQGLQEMLPEDLVAISAQLGEVEQQISGGRAHAQLPGLPIMRIGNVRDAQGCLRSVPNSFTARLPPDGSCRYRPAERLPVWHTDGCHRERPPAGSAFFCRQAPSEGAETCFADAVAAWDSLSEEEKQRLEGLECVCSLAHHDRKLSLQRPDYPTLTPAQRLANPPRRVPLVLRHPATGRAAVYGLNSSTCCIVPKGAAVSQEQMDKYDLEGVEDESVSILRDLIPRFTGPELTVVWRWSEGDLVVWDNRSTMHCGTGYDEQKYVREMWRTTILPEGGLGFD